MSEVEVFRLSESEFNTNKCYEYALKTRTQGIYPNEKYYTTNNLQYLGKYIKSESFGYGDGGSYFEYFENCKIQYDYDGNTCFREVACKKIAYV